MSSAVCPIRIQENQPLSARQFRKACRAVFTTKGYLMQTHDDGQHEFLKRLRERADQMVKDRASEITAGKDGEQPLARWKSHSIHCTHMPPDEQGVLRISIGGGDDLAQGLNLNYCVIRGDRGKCIELLRKSLKALKADLPR